MLLVGVMSPLPYHRVLLPCRTCSIDGEARTGASSSIGVRLGDKYDSDAGGTVSACETHVKDRESNSYTADIVQRSLPAFPRRDKTKHPIKDTSDELHH